MTLRSVFAMVLLIIAASAPAFGGGPLYVAGSGFDSAVAGQPLTWPGGVVNYYTDQGNLSPLLSGATADFYVADAVGYWANVPTAALKITRAGKLDEDVSGSNVFNAGYLILPTDIQPDSPKSIGVIYDYDGSVISAFLGVGAGDADLCNTNSVISMVDKFTGDGHIAHALIILNGNCVLLPADLPVWKYRITREFGRMLGLDWSQLNENVASGSPPPTNDDYAGYPLMHPMAALCSPGYGCMANSQQPHMDDRAAISRLYPVTTTNIGLFSNKTLFLENTARIEGSVRFPPVNGGNGQGMQGVNVVARMIDPATGLISTKYSASCVSGFLFRGNAGNPITGYTDNEGISFDQFGSNDASLEGFFDLAGLEFPAGYSTVRYQLSLESVNRLYVDGLSVGPYKEVSIPMPGTFTPITVTVSKGLDLHQDLVVQGAPAEPGDKWEPNDFAHPVDVPSSGDWIASLSPYGDRDYYRLHARANRTFSFRVTALKENGLPTTSKAAPAIGIWQSAEAENAPSLAQPAFGSMQTGVTQVSADINVEDDYKLGVVDTRGDGRPDFAYEAHVMYADVISPTRAGVHGNTQIAITGYGFTPTTTVKVGDATAQVISQQSGQLIISAPALSDSTQTIYLQDPATGLMAQMTDVLNYGAANARITLLQGSNPQVPVGTQAPNPVRVRVTETDGVTPVADAAVQFVASAGVVFPACGNSNCTLFTDASGEADAYMLVTAAGAFTITASISTGVLVQATVSGVEYSLDISLPKPNAWVASSITGSVPLSAIVVGNGQALAGQTVNFKVMSGTATVIPSSAVTDATGTASAAVNVNHITSDVIVSACVEPGDAPCRNFTIHSVAAANVQATKTSGDNQIITVGQAFADIRLRVTDSSSIPNPVSGMPVQFLVTAFAANKSHNTEWNGEAGTTVPYDPVVLSSLVATRSSDANGYVSLPVSFSANWGPLVITVQASAGISTQTFTLKSVS